jgi:hypothetical protein
MPVPLGYVEVVRGATTVTRPLEVVVRPEEPDPGPFGHLVPVNLPGGAAVDLQVSATVLEHTAAAQRIGILFLPSVPLTGLQVRAFRQHAVGTDPDDHGTDDSDGDTDPDTHTEGDSDDLA